MRRTPGYRWSQYTRLVSSSSVHLLSCRAVLDSSSEVRDVVTPSGAANPRGRAAHRADPVRRPARTGCWPAIAGTDPSACPPNDPTFQGRWEFRSDIPEAIDRTKMHPSEAALGSIGFSLDRAWQRTIGRDDVVIAVLDSGIRWHYADLTEKLYLNAGELPRPEGLHSARRERGRDLHRFRLHGRRTRVGDRNANGRLDPQDLILAFSDCRDDDGNGYTDDISGYDFFSGKHCGREGADNDPADATDFGTRHGHRLDGRGRDRQRYQGRGGLPAMSHPARAGGG